MKTLFNRLFGGTLGLILFSFLSLSQSHPLPSSFSGPVDNSVSSSGKTLEGLHIQPYEMDPESPSVVLSYLAQDAVLSTAVPLQSLQNPTELLDYAETVYRVYFSRPPPRSIAS